jgi:hypothetical protein
MNIHRYIFLLLPFLLAGCSSGDEKIVDLSGVVFAIFGGLIIVKHQTPKVVNSQVFIRFLSALEKYLKPIIYTAYMFSVALIVIGWLLSGIHKILIFEGLSLAIVASNLSKMVTYEDSEKRKIAMEVASLGAGMMVVLFMLWFFGPGMFKAF